jgi:hypothetical protein
MVILKIFQKKEFVRTLNLLKRNADIPNFIFHFLFLEKSQVFGS